MNAKITILPRLLRLRDAPIYLGMDRNRFNLEVRPYITEIRIGKQGVAFDRVDLDRWVDEYKSTNGRRGKLTGDNKWHKKQHPASQKEQVSGTLTNASVDGAFAKALEQIESMRQNDISRN